MKLFCAPSFLKNYFSKGLLVYPWLLVASFPLTTLAQISADDTLPENSLVEQQGAIQRLLGGTAIGTNLFHSFEQFNVLTGETAYFDNALTIENIITRVTGGQVSQIDGLIQANGTTNLFLLNPQGIIFGPNASLNLGGSFFASTAESIIFADGSFFSAVTPNSPPLVTVNIPVGLQMGANPGTITNQSRVTSDLIIPGQITGLQVFPGQTLGLIAGDLSFEGGVVTASGGKVELASLANGVYNLATGEIDAATGGKINLALAAVNTSGLAGGSIRIQGGEVNLTDSSRLLADTFGDFPGGGIEILAQQINLSNGVLISSSSFGAGNAGNITFIADTIEIAGSEPFLLPQQLIESTFDPLNPSDGLYSLSFGSGGGGDITLEAQQLKMRDGANIVTTSIIQGVGGDINLNISDTITISNGSLVLTGTVGAGDAGNLQVTTQNLQLLNGSSFSTTPGNFSTGGGGDLTVNATTVELKGTPAAAPVPGGFFTTTLGTGEAGDLTVNADSLLLADGTQLSTAATGGGQGGNLNVNANLVELRGAAADGQFLGGFFTSSSLLTVAGQMGTSAAGNLIVNTQRLLVQEGAQISVATGGAGTAGNLQINASESIEVSGFITGIPTEVEAVSFGIIGDGIVPSAIDSNTSGMGGAGDIMIQTPSLIVRDGAEIGVRGTSSGAAGNLSIVAEDILLEQQGAITGATVSGSQGNIEIDTQMLQLRDNSRIATDAGNADGGNIEIQTTFLIGLENSDITANAQQGRGGAVSVTALGVFLSPDSQITATSELGAEFSGVVTIQTPEINPNSGLVELPEEVSDPTQQVVAGCNTTVESRFVVTGRGGLPEDPRATLPGSTLWQDLQDFSTATFAQGDSQPNPALLPSQKDSVPVVEATGWMTNHQGKLELVTNLAPGTVTENWQQTPSCSGGVGE